MTISKNSRTKNKNWARVSTIPVYLGEAAYLKDQLKKHGIKSRVNIEDTSSQTKEPAYTVLVSPKDLTKAREIQSRELDIQDSSRTASPPQPLKSGWLLKATSAGLLGIMTGARVGIKMHDKFLYIAFVLGLGAFCFLATWRLTKIRTGNTD